MLRLQLFQIIPFGAKLIHNKKEERLARAQWGLRAQWDLEPLRTDSEPLRSVKIDDNEQVWILDVVNGITGEKISTKSINKSFCSIDADDWVPGIYIINASIDGKMLSKKVILK